MKPSTSFRILIALSFTAGAWILGAAHWIDLTTTAAVGGLVVQIAIVIGTAYGINPRGGAPEPPPKPGAES